jgi:hypothetical protein
MKVKLSPRDPEMAFQVLGLGFLKRPYLQRSVNMVTRGVPLK